MSGINKLKIDKNSLPPAKVTLDSIEVKQIKDSNSNILWGRYLVTNSKSVDDFVKNCCTEFNLKFVDSTNDSVVTGVLANRDYVLNQTNIGYHNENMECNYTVKLPYYVSLDSSNNWTTSYSSTAENYINTDTEIKTINEDPTQYWPKIESKVRNGNLTTNSYTNLTLSSITRISSPNAKAALGKLSIGDKLYYGDILDVVWTHTAPGKVPLSGKSYRLELKGDGVDTAGNVIQNTLYRNQYLFLGNQNIILDAGKFDYPIYFYELPTWVSNSSGGYSLLQGMIGHHPLLRGTKIPIWLCCSNEVFKIDGAGINATVSAYATNDYRKYTLYDTSVPLYSTDLITRSKGTPFKNINGYSILSTTADLNYNATNSAGKVMTKPTHCYLAYIHENKIYKLDLLNNSNGLVNFTLTWSTSGSYLEANESYEDLHIILPKTTIAAPLHISGSYEVDVNVIVYDESNSLATDETFSFSGTFTKLNTPITIMSGTSWFEYLGTPVTENYYAECEVSYRIYDINKNLINTGNFAWETVGVSVTRD